MARNERKAVFAGHFNPFHVGHAYVIEKCLSLNLVDTILVYVSFREKGEDKIFAALDERRAIIKKWVKLKGLKRSVHVYDGYGKVADFFKSGGYTREICGADIYELSVKRSWAEFKLAYLFSSLTHVLAEYPA